MCVRSPLLACTLAVVLPVLLLAGCKSDSTVPSNSGNLAGTYAPGRSQLQSSHRVAGSPAGPRVRRGSSAMVTIA
jgi:hypothetical protein